MSKVFIEEETLIGIGNAIREKNGTTDLIATTDMATAISNLPSGGGILKYIVLSPTSASGTTYRYDLTNYISDTSPTYIFMTYYQDHFTARIENGVLSSQTKVSNGSFFGGIGSNDSRNKISFENNILIRQVGTETYGYKPITVFYAE